MILFGLLIAKLLFINADPHLEYCNKKENSCEVMTRSLNGSNEERFLFYDVDPSEGFNIRREIYKRYAVLITEARKNSQRMNWRLVLPPWYGVYHWRSSQKSETMPWSAYFDIKSLKAYAPVLEMSEVFTKLPSKSNTFKINVLFLLQKYADTAEIDYWEINEQGCQYDGEFWGYTNITVQEVICVRFRGQIKALWSLIDLRPLSRTVMFANSQLPSHQTFKHNYDLQKNYWECRKSMKFNPVLEAEADAYVRNHLDCYNRGCSTYISVHWRRQDFKQDRRIPSVNTTAAQIHEFIRTKCPNVNKIFIATDATQDEVNLLQGQLFLFGYKLYQNSSNKYVLDENAEGRIAIIDQIVCSRAAYFIGSPDSTFTYRIHEEREILGFASKTTYNKLCMDEEDCGNLISNWPKVSNVNEEYERVCF